MIWLALIVAGASLAVSLVVARLLLFVPRIGLQIGGLAVLSVCIPLAAVLLSGWVMFHMGADRKILAVAAGSAAAAGIAGLLLARSIARALRDLTDAARAVASGDLAARAPNGGRGELAAAASAFNTMASSVERLFDARRELVSWASHDLRTPLASLRALIEAAEDGLVDVHESLPTLREQAAALTAIVDDLFELAQIDAGALALELQRVEIGELVSATVRVLTPEAAVRGVVLSAEVAPGAVTVAPDKIERVLANLIGNALRHTPADGAVAVRVEQADAQVRVHVEDTGAGFAAAETPARMFERFWRGDRARTEPGAGLGLAIARGLVEAHGGRIWAENRAHGGARVSFSLPAAP